MKPFKPILIAAAVIALIELGAWRFGDVLGANHFRTGFVPMGYMLQDPLSKYGWEVKLNLIGRLKPDVVQVGDSSGLTVRPSVVEEYLGGKSYVSMSCCGDMGYRGHTAMAEAAITRAPTIRYIVFYVTPYAAPEDFGVVGPQLAGSLRREFTGFWRYLYPPSMALRTWVTNAVYYFTPSSDILVNPANQSGNGNALPPEEVEKEFLETRGNHFYFRTQENAVTGTCNLDDLTQIQPMAEYVMKYVPLLSQAARMAREKGVKLVLVFNPVACRAENSLTALLVEREIARFRALYPDVVMPFPVVTTWDRKYFADRWHLHDWAGERSSRRIGEVLRKMLENPEWRGVPVRSVAEIEKEIATLEQKSK